MFHQIFTLIAMVTIASAQFLVPPPKTAYQDITYVAQPRAVGSRTHKDVVFNAQLEQQLAPEQVRSAKFYTNPAIAAELAKTSDLGAGEFRLKHREADNIPRSEILKIVRHAGFVDRR